MLLKRLWERGGNGDGAAPPVSHWSHSEDQRTHADLYSSSGLEINGT
ncbi:hypothetical protein [Streptomyces sp. NPDC051162]